MFPIKMVDKTKIKNILVITLSNIGDIVLTLPVIDALRVNYSGAELSIMVSRQAKELFKNNPDIGEVIVYDKKASAREKLRLVLRLRKKKYDLVLDLRNTLFPYLLGASYHSSAFSHAPASVHHMRERHLWKLKSVIGHKSQVTSHKSQVASHKSQVASHKSQVASHKLPVASYKSAWVRPEDERYVSQFLKERGVRDGDKLVGVSPGARSHIKRWKKEGFRYICQKLICERDVRVVMIGDKEELPLSKEIISGLKNEPILACGKTSLTQLFGLLNRCLLLISNDTAAMHIAGYLEVPVVAIFGPTDPDKYKPQGESDIVVRKELSCSPCERALCQSNCECMQLIMPDEVFAAADKLLFNKAESGKMKNYKSQIPNHKP